MWPTFLPKGDVVLVEKLTHKWGQLLPGDIVTCTSPEDPTLSICKRVAALEGSAVAVPVSDDFQNPLTHFLGFPQYEMLEVGAFVEHDCRSQVPKTCAPKELRTAFALHYDNPVPNELKGILLHCTSQVPRGHVWLLGDNAPVSHDSRSYGPVPYALITGRVFAQVRLAAGATGDAVCCVLSAFLP